MNKITKIILGMILLFLISFTPAFGSGSNGYVELNVELGFDGYVKIGRHMNAIAEVSTTEGFTGSVSVVVPTLDGRNYLYKYPITLQDGESDVIQMNFPLFTRNSILYFKVENDSGKVLAKTDKMLNRTPEVTEIYIGVLSETREISELLEDINLGEYVISSYPYIGTRVMDLAPTDIGDTKYRLDGLDVLILDEAGMDTLSTKQYSAIEEWNDSGGVLLLESKDDILEISSGEERSEIWMGDLDDRELLNLLIETAFTTEVLNKIISKDLYYDGYEEYYTISNMLNTSIGTELPNLFWYILVVGLYILLIGPLLFFFLRKKKATSWTTSILICLSIVFSIVVYLMGSNTRFSEPFLQYATILKRENGNTYEETFFNIRAPYNKPFVVTLPSSYVLNPVPQSSYYSFNTYEDLEEPMESSKDFKTTLSFTSDSSRVLIEKNAPFSSEYFKVEKEIKQNDLKDLLVEATYYNDILTGIVTNQTDMDLGYVTLVLCGKVVLIGDLNKGESAKIEDHKLISYSPYYYYETARRITGLNEDLIVNKESLDYAQLLSKTNLIEYFFSKNFIKFSNHSSIIGFVKSDEYNKFNVNEDYPAYGVTLIESDVSLRTTVNGLKYEVLTSKSISNVDREYNYDGISNTTYSGNIRLQYEMGNIETLEELHFIQELQEDGYTYYQPFSGKMYFYNGNTLEYDLISFDKKTFVKEELLNYFYEEDGKYSILVQYIAENVSSEKYTEIQLPSVRLIRRED